MATTASLNFSSDNSATLQSRDFFTNLMQGKKKDVDFKVFFVFLTKLIMHLVRDFKPFA
jgi:hypothetical protein